MIKKKRCSWCLNSPTYIAYHDQEWGVPVHDDRTHFEFLVLEGAQAGLSWSTILNRREGYREVFMQFDVQQVAHFTASKVEALLTDKRIIRNRLKVESAINNATRFLAIQNEFGSFDRYIWGFVNNKPINNRWHSPSQVPAHSAVSDTLSLDLKKRGLKFVGSIIVYAHMQACGLVNDHLIDCFRYREINALHKQR